METTLSIHETFSYWLLEYGSLTLFILLALGIIALPVPEETLMVMAGVLMADGHLHIHWTILAALGGSICGITVSYLVGATAGSYFLSKYGGWLGIKQEHIQKAHEWFEHYGKWSLFIGYFIPGIRHFTGFTAGTTKLAYHEFALFAYTGALFWVSTFLSVGYFFGHYWLKYLKNVEIGLDNQTTLIIVLLLFAIGAGLFFWRKSTSGK